MLTCACTTGSSQVGIDKDIYLKWFTELSRKKIPVKRQILLIVDGDKAHVTREVIEATASPATKSSSHFLSCCTCISSHLTRSILVRLTKTGVGEGVVNQCNFAKVFNVAWHSSATPEVIRGGLKGLGTSI